MSVEAITIMGTPDGPRIINCPTQSLILTDYLRELQAIGKGQVFDATPDTLTIRDSFGTEAVYRIGENAGVATKLWREVSE